MAQQEIATVPEMLPDAVSGFYVQTRDELETPVSFEDAVNLSGLSAEDLTFEGSPYRVLNGKEKAELINRPFFLRAWRFAQGDMGPYVLGFAVVQGTNEHVIFSDGSTGIHKQLDGITRKRMGADHPTPFENLVIPNGLRASEYDVTEDGVPAKKGEKVASKATTYYLA